MKSIACDLIKSNLFFICEKFRLNFYSFLFEFNWKLKSAKKNRFCPVFCHPQMEHTQVDFFSCWFLFVFPLLSTKGFSIFANKMISISANAHSRRSGFHFEKLIPFFRWEVWSNYEKRMNEKCREERKSQIFCLIFSLDEVSPCCASAKFRSQSIWRQPKKKFFSFFFHIFNSSLLSRINEIKFTASSVENRCAWFPHLV